jgi:ElaB/YqjD/DUF883 family membrane-anchored ribosome-binding protein
VNINDSTERALEQARELRRSINDALNKATDELKPQIESTLRTARELQTTFIKHMEAEGEMAAKSMTAALAHLQDFIALGAQALQDSSDQLRTVAKRMLEQSMKIAEAAASATTTAIPSQPSYSSPRAPQTKSPEPSAPKEE